MVRAVVQMPSAVPYPNIAGRDFSEHWLWICAMAGLEADLVAPGTPAPAGGILLVDGRYAGVDPRALAALAATLPHGGGWLRTTEGGIVAAALMPGSTARDLSAPADHEPSDPPLLDHRAVFVADEQEHSRVERLIRDRVVAELGVRGVRFVRGAPTVIDTTVTIETGSTIWPSVTLLGQTHIARGAVVHQGAWLEDCLVGPGAVIKPYSVCSGAQIGEGATVGPFAHLRPGADLGPDTKVGNFVEVKKTRMERGAKASHLTYLGDALIGAEANIGAGTITCNYDGFGKHRTEIGAGAFIGSNTALIAPISVGPGAIVGAGSTLSSDVPEQTLAVERSAVKLLQGKAPAIRRRNARRAGKEPPTE